ncbi:hypothetical protein KIW84_035716 [Lathyrus oleraceus]|uniref:Uncharacterized protein n=1 Tax=Pisum sativum TaxID=3888 RepID=A0A9D4Y2M0_PEA|nr:hypothetical protein KIW84_035716 [Pisum sativum]
MQKRSLEHNTLNNSTAKSFKHMPQQRICLRLASRLSPVLCCCSQNEVVHIRVASSSASNVATAEPDLELLVVLLKNPDLVFALTSGQIGNISNEETLKLFDMIKRGSVNTGLSENANRNYGTSSLAPEKVEVSLPSPTPSSNPSTSGCSIETPKNPFTRQNLAPDRRSFQSSSSIATADLSSQISATSTTARQQHTFVPFSKQLPGTAVSTYSLPQPFLR